MFLISYVIKAAQDALKDLNVPLALDVEPVGAPVIAPPDALLFPEEVLRQIAFHKDKVLVVQDFEGFMALLDEIVAELQLDPGKGRTDLAAVLNSYRQAANLTLY